MIDGTIEKYCCVKYEEDKTSIFVFDSAKMRNEWLEPLEDETITSCVGFLSPRTNAMRFNERIPGNIVYYKVTERE